MTKRILTAAAVGVMLGLAQQAGAQNLAITNVRIVVGNGRVIEEGSIVVVGGRIVAVEASATAPAGTPTIDGRGLTAVPGFIDAHRHIITRDAEQWLKEQSVDRMREFLEAGYTTLMSGGGPMPGIMQLKQLVDSGQLKGPRIITSARADPDLFKTEEEARAMVRSHAAAGAEIIKARLDPELKPRQVELLKVVIDEAHKHNLEVMVHAVNTVTMVEAVKAGAQKLVHTPHEGWLTEAEARLVRDAGIEMLSTIGFAAPVFGVFNKDNVPTARDGSPWPSGIPDSLGRGREAGGDAVNARTLWDAGVTYGFGTDTTFLPQAGLAHELKALNLMFSPQDITKLMGPNTAAFINKTKELGTLEVGKLADIVLLAGNPLEGYWNLLNPKSVIKGGEVVVDRR